MTDLENKDWFESAMEYHAACDAAQNSGPVSASWSEWRPTGDVARDLRTIRGVARNIARVHGIPADCRVDLASLGQNAAGVAGFEDLNTFSGPYIVLDKSVYESCASEDVLDIYCGVVLHEAAHICSSRQIYVRLQAAGVSATHRIYENLWEDERIEEQARQESPGFAPYLSALKRVLFDGGGIGESAKNWAVLPDVDRVNVLLFTFVRCPYLIEPEMQAWKTVDGECVFDTLRSLFPTAPKSEEDVGRFAAQLEDLWQRLRRNYDKRIAEAPREHGVKSSAEGDRVERQRQADIDDCLSGDFGTSEENERRLLSEAERLLEAGETDGADKLLAAAIQRSDANSGADSIVPEPRKERFGVREILNTLERFSVVHRPLDGEESSRIELLDAESISTDGRWEWNGDRQTTISYPVADEDALAIFTHAEEAVSRDVAAMTRALSFRPGDRKVRQRELSRGQIDRRRLALGAQTGRVFQQTRIQEDQGLAICLLLDESGSMAGGHPAKGSTALDVAVLMTQALRAVKGVELEVYSHTSCGPAQRDCLVRYLHGARNPQASNLGCYRPQTENYDHQAILTAAELFARNTRSSRKIMIVMSDGAPSGVDYGGNRAISETKSAVDAVRTRGIAVVGVAIDDDACGEIYGSNGVVTFTDMTRLVADMRRLVTGIVRKYAAG